MIPFWLKICISLEDTKLTNWQTLQDIGCKSRRHWPCSVRNALPSHIQQYIQLLQKQISIVHSLSIIQDNLCLKREKETTVCYCYKWWPMAMKMTWWPRPRRQPKLETCFIKSQKLHTQSLETLWQLSVPKIIAIMPDLFKLFKL